MPISGSRSPGHIGGDPTRSREAARAASASNTARQSSAVSRAAEVAALSGDGTESAPVVPGAEPDTGGKADTVGGRVLMVDSENWIDVPPERIPRWLENFAERHGGPVTLAPVPHGFQATAADETVADCYVPFPRGWAPEDGADLAVAAAEHAAVARRVGVVLVRLGGYAIGVFNGEELVSSKVGGKQVASRQSNGGWSQSRYANRRANQAESHLGAAADTAARILLPAKLDALVVGGESRAVGKVLTDRRLEPLITELGIEQRILTVPDPRLEVLRSTPATFRALRIRLLVPEAPLQF
jgi:hypothetical protein